MKRTIITGATGFVGANLARRLLRDGHEVHLLVRPGFAAWRIAAIADDVQLHEVDLTKPADITPLLTRIQPDWIFHLAVHGAYSSQVDLRQMIDTNILATATLLQASTRVGFESFVNTGSSSEYGYKDHAPAESEAVDPNSYYAVTKASSTMLCRYVATKQRAHIPTLRLYSVYGPWEEPSRLIPTLIVHAQEGRLPPLVNPEVARDYVYVDDVVEAYMLAAEARSAEPGAIYNVGSGVQTSLREVVDLARHLFRVAAAPMWGTMAERAWDTSIWVSNPRKIEQELGWRAVTALADGMRRTAGWLTDDETVWQRYRERIL